MLPAISFCIVMTGRMASVTDLINAGYRHWNEPGRLVEIAEELEVRSRLEQARLFLERALTLAPEEYPNAYYTLAFTYFRDSGNRAEDGENALMDGIEATDSDIVKAWYAAMLEDDALAEVLLAEVIENTDISVRFAFGGALHWRGRAEEALGVFRETAARVPAGETPDGLETMCSSLIWMKSAGMDIDLDAEVRPRLADLVRNYPDRYNVLAMTVQYFQALRDWNGVENAALRLLSVIPDEETTMLALAISYRNTEQSDKAIMWLNRAVGAKPSFSRARVILAAMYEKTGKPELAEAVAREIPVTNPGYAIGKLQAADVLRRVGKQDDAIAMFREGYAALKPFEKGEVHANLAELTALAGIKA
jgi:tetratricopeptide (TPR) repeat protein